jgi:hypothetical protein
VSIYMPTHRTYPDVQQDHIRYKNMVRAVEEALPKSYPGRDVRGLTDQLRRLQDDADFWASARDGLAVLASPSRFDVFKLPRTVPERVEVADTFHVKPLLRHVQSADHFHVLGVARERVALFEGNRYELTALEVPGLPLTLTDALGTETGEPPRRRPAAAEPGAAVPTGQGSGKQDVLPDVPRFFRAVDRKVTELVSNPSGWPLLVAGVEDNLSEFRAVSRNPYLLSDGVLGDWTNLSLHEIREKAWGVYERHYLARLARLKEDYGTAVARNQGTADLKEAARAAGEGRVGFLLIDADKALPGSIELATGAVRPAGPADPHPGDMLDDLAELALRNGGTVVVVPSDRMPTATGLAAIFRY